MSRARKIVVEAMISAEVEVVWDRTQTPSEHVRWDIRFDSIEYLDRFDARGFRLMDYRTSVGFGITVQGTGRYLQNIPPRHSTFEFESADWKSIITRGRGIWLYEPCAGGTYFKTVYDYEVRYGVIGAFIDAFIFRRLIQLATEWGFETLRRWCGGDDSVLEARRQRARFVKFFLARWLGRKPLAGAARSWLGTGQESELKLGAEFQTGSAT
jgi:hypothetical protein